LWPIVVFDIFGAGPGQISNRVGGIQDGQHGRWHRIAAIVV
jgi:hypothetical protein